MPTKPNATVLGRANPYRGHRFPTEVIAHAVRRYLRFALSYRDVEELLAGRGIAVSSETVRRWVAESGTQYANELRRRESRLGRMWHIDEMATRVGGQLQWLWRAVDEHGQTLDVLVQEHRDTAAAERFFRRLLVVTDGAPPELITTDTLGSYAAALARLPALAHVANEQVRSARRCNNRVEQAHQPTRIRERVMRRFKSLASAQRFPDAFSRVGNLSRPGRHRLAAAAYRATMRERGARWCEVVRGGARWCEWSACTLPNDVGDEQRGGVPSFAALALEDAVSSRRGGAARYSALSASVGCTLSDALA